MNDDPKSVPESEAGSETEGSRPVQVGSEPACSTPSEREGEPIHLSIDSPLAPEPNPLNNGDTSEGSPDSSALGGQKSDSLQELLLNDGKGEDGIETSKPTTAPLRPAAWEVKEPTDSWCPASLEDDIGIRLDYLHDRCWSSTFGPGWKIAAATKRGRMHAHQGTFREDALWGATSESFTFFTVCDGAGSSKLSRIGSEYTARKLSELVRTELQAHQKDISKCSKESLPLNLRVILHHCVDSVARDLVSLADKSGLEPKDFRCTVLTVLHYRHQTGGILLFGNVGDGFLAVKRKGQPAERIGTSDSGAFSGEVTCFMPDPPVSEFYRKSLEENAPIPEEDVEAYILCTDGIEDPFFPVHRNVVSIFDQLFEGYQESIQDVKYPNGQEPKSVIRSSDPGLELLKWLSFEKRGENDDRTITLIYREELALLPGEAASSARQQAPQSKESSVSTEDGMRTKPDEIALSTDRSDSGDYSLSAESIRSARNRRRIIYEALLFTLGLSIGIIIGHIIPGILKCQFSR